jgi:hypothetical protein
LEESYRVNQERLKQVQKLEEEVKKLEQELVRWEAQEKQRVADMLVDNCKKNLKKVAKEVEPIEEEEVNRITELECPQAPSGFNIDRILMGQSPDIRFFGRFADLSCFFLKKVTPEFEHIVNLVYTGVRVWQFNSASEAEEEFEALIYEVRGGLDKSNILDDSKDRFMIEIIQRGNKEDFLNNTYKYTDYFLVGFILHKNFVINVYSNADIPSSYEAKAITIAKAACTELEENTKLVLEGGK